MLLCWPSCDNLQRRGLGLGAIGICPGLEASGVWPSLGVCMLGVASCLECSHKFYRLSFYGVCLGSLISHCPLCVMPGFSFGCVGRTLCLQCQVCMFFICPSWASDSGVSKVSSSEGSGFASLYLVYFYVLFFCPVWFHPSLVSFLFLLEDLCPHTVKH